MRVARTLRQVDAAPEFGSKVPPCWWGHATGLPTSKCGQALTLNLIVRHVFLHYKPCQVRDNPKVPVGSGEAPTIKWSVWQRDSRL